MCTSLSGASFSLTECIHETGGTPRQLRWTYQHLGLQAQRGGPPPCHNVDPALRSLTRRGPVCIRIRPAGDHSLPTRATQGTPLGCSSSVSGWLAGQPTCAAGVTPIPTPLSEDRLTSSRHGAT